MVLTAPKSNREVECLKTKIEDLEAEVTTLIQMIEDDFGRQWLRFPIKHQIEKLRDIVGSVYE